MTDVTSWRDQIEIHPAADLFPLMSETDLKGLQAMADSIAKNPMQVPDLMPVIHAELLNPDRSSLSQSKWKFTLLDGRNRLDAMTLAGIKFALRPNPKSLPSTPGWLLDVDRGGYVISYPLEVEQGDPWEYVRRANIERRMLNSAGKRELIKRLLKDAPEKSDRAIGKLVGRDKNTVAKVRAEEEARGEIPHVKTRVDTKGRKSPSKKKKTKKGTSPAEPEPTEPGHAKTDPKASNAQAGNDDTPADVSAKARMAAYAASEAIEHADARPDARPDDRGTPEQHSANIDDVGPAPAELTPDHATVAAAAVNQFGFAELQSFLDQLSPAHQRAFEKKFGTRNSDNTNVEIATLAGECTALLAHPKQHIDDIYKKLARIKRLAGGKGKGRSKGLGKSNAHLDLNAFGRGMGLARAAGDGS